ncbi:hypothetical protein Pan216_40000 [Planctomycetes bacterium Pan216]|uniref:Alkyl hydroperoxide reductase subunit C/ Thiol specific antioxidant domain-containing protein n=2 Tax=Kolteria novifilia TaxID=2527975 RepID=A0A518B825_9BACT|nr:hypothetical protein Pan216_40000 [Planctomycetes bacterium Pan216]
MNTLACMALGLVIAAGGEQWTIRARWLVGQEVSYKGSIVESGFGTAGATYQQPVQLETSLLVLDLNASGIAQAASYTVTKMPDQILSSPRAGETQQFRSVHFDMVKIDLNGLATWATNDANVLLPSEGMAPWELGFLVEMPKRPIKKGERWVTRRPGQPLIRYQVHGQESVRGIPCVKVKMRQESGNWSKRDVGLTAWRSKTTAWIDPKTGFTERIERLFEVRKPADREPSRRIEVHYDAISKLRYHGPIFQDRQADLVAGFEAQRELDRNIAAAGPASRRKIETVRSKLESVMNNVNKTPYRPAIAALKQRATMALEETDPVTLSVRSRRRSVAKIGSKAKSLVVRNAETDESLSVRKMKGTPLVLVFVDPDSDLSLGALSLAVESVKAQGDQGILLVAIANEVNATTVKAMHENVPGDYVVASGPVIDSSYGVDARPHTIIIDAAGYLRGNYVGFGPELPSELMSTLYRYVTVENLSRSARKSETFLR